MLQEVWHRCDIYPPPVSLGPPVSVLVKYLQEAYIAASPTSFTAEQLHCCFVKPVKSKIKVYHLSLSSLLLEMIDNQN